MKNIRYYFILSAIIISAFCLASCKNKDANNSNINTVPTDTITAAPEVKSAPVIISPDDSLNTMAKDAVKDFPGVTAAVMNGEVTLTGNIKREKLRTLMSAVSAMHPKKIKNNLTINP